MTLQDIFNKTSVPGLTEVRISEKDCNMRFIDVPVGPTGVEESLRKLVAFLKSNNISLVCAVKRYPDHISMYG